MHPLLKLGPAGHLQGMFVILIVIYELAMYGKIVFVRFKFLWISLNFLSMIIYEVSYTYMMFKYIICSAWFLDIRISTCY